MELIIVRHGLPLRVETEDGTPADPPLSDEGRTQAERLADWLGADALDHIYSSPMRRAVETAAPLASRLGLEPTVEAGVAEFDQHADSYIPLEDMKRVQPQRYRELMEGGWHGGPDPAVFRQTVIDTLDGIVRAHAGQRVAVICHGGVINVWASHVLEMKRMLFFQPGYTSVNRFMGSSRGHRSVVSLNEMGHLRG